jgi:hypothetical protein
VPSSAQWWLFPIPSKTTYIWRTSKPILRLVIYLRARSSVKALKKTHLKSMRMACRLLILSVASCRRPICLLMTRLSCRRLIRKVGKSLVLAFLLAIMANYGASKESLVTFAGISNRSKPSVAILLMSSLRLVSWPRRKARTPT